MPDDLAACLRAWRQRADPALAGVAPGASRRTRGLRREEVAARAGISVNYLVRLEQGRAQSPSASVVTALARALDLTGDETEHLHRLTGLAAPTARRASREVTPALQRLVERFADTPLIVVDAAWTIVAGNALSAVFLGDDPVGENAACRQFLGPPLVDRAPEDDEAFERDLVGELHRQAVRHPDDEAVREVVAQLRARSERFAALWDERPAGIHASSRKTFTHARVGRVTVDCDVLEARGTDLRVVVWTAAPGTPDAEAMAQLRGLAEQDAAALA
ncbi:helix-turn-helix domain-containing protein [uncultured Pseudokineococcus sp.]|uniref:helix-turn-helix domain-containing protein n=1 Tax=uncultured Pseudokineococcus sp. TaxID=1642928 RepID=UPI00262F60C2|nr:helix-turn-helix domain-containing protein [uncultured Pseudokineococcus sp.]